MEVKKHTTDINKDPYSNLQNFIHDERSVIETKIHELRMRERQKILSMKKKTRRAMSNSFHNFNEFPYKRSALNTTLEIEKNRSPVQTSNENAFKIINQSSGNKSYG
jgi:hypothetical protein